MKSLTSTQIREIQNAISLITSAYNEGYISQEVADEARSMLRNQLQKDGKFHYVQSISELLDLEQQYCITNGTVCFILNTGQLYMYCQGEWMEMESEL